MSEKPEALRLAEELYAFHAAKKEMPSVGGQMLGLERYRIVATGEAFSQILDAADKLIRQHAEIERLRDENRLWKSRCIALVWKGDTDNITAGRLQSAAKEIDAALRREET